MIWFDFDNTPHVPLYRPILRELQARGVETFVTSRLHAQTEDLLRMWEIPHVTVGTYGGKSLWKKVGNLLQRAHALSRVARPKPITLSVSHNSRTHMVASKWLGLRYLGMDDYEYSEQRLANLLADYLLMPVHIPDERLAGAGFNLKKVIRYNGLKEEIYLKDFVPEPGFRERLGIDEQTILVTRRPPSTTANYHDEKSEILFRKCLQHFSSAPDTYCLIVNRTDAERKLVSQTLVDEGKVGWLPRAVDGLQLLWHSDIMLGGGGTMNREAALLGLPTYSIFTGRRPSVDEYLQAQGKLRFINDNNDVDAIPIQKRDIQRAYLPTNANLASWITDLILDINDRRS
jgi:predicted glycosyltransferase